MDQGDFIRRVTESPNQFAWFLGAGTSQSAGLPTAWDIIWDLKRRYYTTEEDQVVPPNDIQNVAVRQKIQSYMLSKGFPEEGAPEEYSRYFELIFGDDRERQRRYISSMLAESKASLSIGHRALAAMMCSNLTKAVFTTNFDTIIEAAAAEVAGKAIAAFHIEGAYATNAAINAEEYPVYCKLHGDFRFQSIKNLSEDLKEQNEELSKGFLNACNRFGLIVAGYSGRDDSVMDLLERALQTSNPFPYGIFWTKLKNSEPLPIVRKIIASAQARGVTADIVDIETFDSMMSRIWRQIDSRDRALDAKVGKAASQQVSIPVPPAGKGDPVIRSNGLPIVEIPRHCLSLTFSGEMEWADLRAAEKRSGDSIICTKGDGIFAWGTRARLSQLFGGRLTNIQECNLTDRLRDLDNNLYLKQFLERALGTALARNKPLLLRPWRGGYTLIVDRHAGDQTAMAPLKKTLRNLSGDVGGLFTKPTDEHPESQQIAWAEAAQIDLEERDGKFWLLLKPEVWIWPKWAREQAVDFLDKHKGGRFNRQADQILTDWISTLVPAQGKAADIRIAPFAEGGAAENPTFVLNTRTAYSRRVTK